MATKVSRLLSKFQGSSVTAVAGDCLGSHFEGGMELPIEEVCDYLAKRDKISYFTDDTAMARSVAASLLDHKKVEPTDMAKRFASEFFADQGRGYGGNIRTVFHLLRQNNFSDPYGPARKQFDGSGSYGNGGAMRIQPAALYAYDLKPEDINSVVSGITRITHTHRDAINGACLQCHAVIYALNHPTHTEICPDGMIDELIARMEPLEAEDLPEEDDVKEDEGTPAKLAKTSESRSSQPYCEKLRSLKTYLKEDTSVSEVIDHLGNDVSALGSVVTALYAFLKCLNPLVCPKLTNPLERTIYFAISLGGDTDTIATMAGAMAGAYYGMEQVPPDWLKLCEGAEDAQEQATAFHNLKTLSSVSSAPKL